MSSSYFVTYGGDRLTYGGTPGPVAWEYVPPPVRRYEYTLYHNAGRSGVSAGTLNSSISGFDEIMVGVGWPGNYNQFGIQWMTFNAQPNPPTTMAVNTLIAGTNNTYYMYNAILSINTGTNTFSVGANGSANRWMVKTTGTNTGTWTLQDTANAANKITCITDIVGVKYR